jgi:hypothetical protein
MKRILKIGQALFLFFLIPAAIMSAQEKKNEQRIKIIVTDKSGTKAELDTLITGSTRADSIKMKNGEVIYLAKHGEAGKTAHMKGDKSQMYVTVVSDDKGEKKTEKKIMVISGDSASVLESGEGNEVVIIRDGKYIIEGKVGKVVAFSSSGSNSQSTSYIYVNEDNNSDKKENTVEKTKYVIAKDGMVVTIEGNDEVKVNELLKEVEAKLGVNKKDKAAKKITKE